MMMRFLSVLLLTALATLSATAKPLKIRAFALSSEKHPECFVKGNNGYEPLVFSKIQPSRALKATLQSPLPIYVVKEGAIGNNAYSVVAKVPLPPKAASILLIDVSTEKGVKFVAIQDDISSAGSRDWMLVNASTKPIAFQVGAEQKPIRVNPGKSKSYRIEATAGEGAAVTAKAPFDEKIKTVFSTYWPIASDKRNLVLFIEHKGKIRVKRITERVGSAKK